MLRHLVLSAVALLTPATFASAQVIFEPVRYQYGHRQAFYYGGSDPAVIARGLAVEELRPQCSSPADIGSCNHSLAITRVYTDRLPWWNAALFGYTANDAHNEARANLPLYFRKADLFPPVALPAGSQLTIPAQAQPIPRVTQTAATKRPAAAAKASEPAPILIIPKDKLKVVPRTKPAMFVAAGTPANAG